MQRQLIDIPFASGYHQKTDQRWAELGSQYSVVNGLWVKANEIQKRPGTTALSKTEATTAGALTKASKLYSYKNELGLIDGQYVRARVPTGSTWTAKDETSPCVAIRDTVSQFGTGAYNADVSEAFGYRMFVWTDSASTASSLYFTMIEVASGTVIGTGWVGNTSQSVRSPRVFAMPASASAKFYLVYQRTSDSNIVARTFDTAALSSGWSAEIVLTASAAANTALDAVPTIGGSSYILAFEGAAGPPYLNLFLINTSNTVTSSAGVVGEAGNTFLAITLRSDLGDGLLWVIYSKTSGQVVNGTVYNPSTLVQTTAPFNIQPNTATAWGYYLGVERLDATHVCVVMGTNTKFQWCSIGVSGATTIGFKPGFGLQPLSRPFAVSSLDSIYGVRVYMLCAYAQTSQSTQFLVELDNRLNTGLQLPHPVATVAPRFSFTGLGTSIRAAGPGCSVTNLGTTTATSYVIAGTIAESQAVHGRTAVASLTFDFAHPGLYTCAELGESIYISGGVPCSYDGTSVWECGSLVAIDMTSFGASVTRVAGGSLSQPFTYSWIFVPEWHDARGQRKQGQPSLPVSGTATTAGQQKYNITVPIPSLSLSGEPQDVNLNLLQGYLVPYRTCVVGGVMSTIYYRTIGDVPPAGWNLQFPNPAAGVFTYADDGTGTFSDATAATAESLYTTGGIIESDCPPSFTTLCAHKNRIYGVGDDQKTIWFSTEYVPGQVVRFSDALTFSLEDMGNVVACWSMDDKLFFASKSRVVYFTGSGPNETGNNSDLAGPFRIASDVGCIDPRSVVVTPAGTFFQSRIGIALLDRGLSLKSTVGDTVEDILAVNSVIVAATLHPTRPEVLFSCVPSPGTSITTGVVLSYNYRFNTWSQLKYWDPDKSRSSAGVVSMVASNGTLYMSTPFGQVLSENANPSAAGGCLDPGSTWIQLAVESAWIKPAGLQGFARMWKILLDGQWQDYCDMQINIASDYATGYAQSTNYLAGFNAASGIGGAMQLETRLVTPRGQAYRFQYIDSPPTGFGATSGQGTLLVGLTAEVGVKDRAFRLPAARRG